MKAAWSKEEGADGLMLLGNGFSSSVNGSGNSGFVVDVGRRNVCVCETTDDEMRIMWAEDCSTRAGEECYFLFTLSDLKSCSF